MKKRFIPLHSFPKRVLESGEANKFLYKRVRYIASKTPLRLDGDDLEIGKEVYMVPNGCKEVVPVIVVGYELCADLITYDDDKGVATTEYKIILMDEKGERYIDGDYINFYDTMEEAEEVRQEMKEELEDED